MWHWLKRWLTISEDIFTATIAGARRRFDPLEVWRKLEQRGGIHWLDMVEPLRVAVLDNMPQAAIENLHRARQHAIATLADWVRFAFDLKPFAEGGPTDAGCLDLLAELLWFVNHMADTYRPFSICSKRDAPSPSTVNETQKV